MDPSRRDNRTCARSLAHDFLKDTGGATAIEYGLIAGLLSVTITAAMSAIGLQVAGLFDAVAKAFPTK
jgi:pilus assembly protein Flp/PilA